jgi:four helix bundle protein
VIGACAYLGTVHKYRSLVAWQRAHALVLEALQRTDAEYHPRARPLFEQLRRAVVSVETNIVEGYALGTPALFRRHLRIALGSAAEAECLVRLSAELGYLAGEGTDRLGALAGGTIATLQGLLRKPMAIKV